MATEKMQKHETQTAITMKKQSQLKEIWRRYKKNRLAMIGLISMLVLIVLVLAADLIEPYEVCITMNLREKLLPPSAEHLFGTDGYGRDILARCLHGGRISLFIGFTCSIVSMFFGAIFGMIAGYYGDPLDNIIMRIMDVLSAIPNILLALAIVAALGSSIFNLIMALTISHIPGFARVVRSSVLGITGQEYIEAARAGGTGDARILRKHILPNALGPLIVQTTMSVSSMILAAASMSFLGLGVNPPQPEWGSIISEAREFLRTNPTMILFPGICIILASLSMNLIGDGLRDALDPRLKS